MLFDPKTICSSAKQLATMQIYIEGQLLPDYSELVRQGRIMILRR